MGLQTSGPQPPVIGQVRVPASTRSDSTIEIEIPQDHIDAMLRVRLSAILAGAYLAVSAMTAQPAPAPAFVWEGLWVGRIPEHGLIAVNFERRHGESSPRAFVWWIVAELSVASVRFDRENIHIEGFDHQGKSTPALAFTVTPRETLALTAVGALPEPLSKIFSGLELRKVTGGSMTWHGLTDFRVKDSEYNRWHEYGSLKILPANWNADVAIASTRLFRYDSARLHRFANLPMLPGSFLSEIDQWMNESPPERRDKYLVRKMLARHRNCEPVMLQTYWAQTQEPVLWLAVARNHRGDPAWAKSVVDRILQAGEQVQRQALFDEDCPTELYLAVLINGRLRAQIAADKRTPPAVLNRLEQDYSTDADVLRNLAQNRSAPPELLLRLSQQHREATAYDLIANPAFPKAERKSLVVEFSAKVKLHVRERFVHDPDAPAEFLALCATDLDPALRMHTAKNPNTDLTTLTVLAADETRAVAESAREVLKQRFPSHFESLAPAWKPLEKLNEAWHPTYLFEKAAEAGDTARMRRIADYLREKGELSSALGNAASITLKTGRTEIMDWLVAAGYNERGTAFPMLAAQCGGDARWLDYFAAHGAFSPERVGIAFVTAVESGKSENLAALIARKLDPNGYSSNGETALHVSVMRRDMPAISALIAAGADPTLPDDNKQSAVDYAYRLKMLPAVRLMDLTGKYAAAVREFEAQYPPAQNSRFLGEWINAKGDFGLQLKDDGTGRIIGIYPIPFAWKELDRDEAQLVIQVPGEETVNSDVRLRFDAKGNRVLLQFGDKPPEVMRPVKSKQTQKQ
jgi:hypothetical protein